MSALNFRTGPAWSERRYPVPGGQPLLLWLPRATLLVAAQGSIELSGSCNALAWLGAQTPRLRVAIEDGGHYVLPQSGHVFLSAASGQAATLIVQRPASPTERLLAGLKRRGLAGGPRGARPDA